MSEINTITVKTSDSLNIRRGITNELEVSVLAENVNLFVLQMESILEKVPEDIGKFRFTELTISAEISAEGKLVLLGTGIETTATGAVAFKFERSK